MAFNNFYQDQQEIIVDQQSLTEVPFSFISNFQYSITLTLDLSNNEIHTIPTTCFNNFPSLKALILHDNKLVSIPTSISCLKKLTTLKIDHNDLHSLPQEIGDLESLEIFSVSKNFLLTIPKTIGKLKNSIKLLNFNDNCLRFLPSEFCQLSSLVELHLYNNRFDSLPYSLGCLQSLKILCIEWFQYAADITGIPEETILLKFRQFCAQLIRHKKSCFNIIDMITEFGGGRINFATKPNINCLHKAAYNNHLGILEQLAKVIRNVNAKDQSDYTPLCIAIEQKNTEAALILLNAGASPTIGVSSVGTPLNIAVGKLNVCLVKELIRRGVNVNSSDKETLNTALHVLMTKFHKSSYKARVIAELLIVAGANPNTLNRDGWAPLHFAAKKRAITAMRWITEYNKKAKESNLPLFDINLQGGSVKLTALHLAAHSDSYEIVKELVANGADVFAQNEAFRTPRFAAKGNLAIYKYLRRVEMNVLSHIADPVLYSNTEPLMLKNQMAKRLFTTDMNETEAETMPTSCNAILMKTERSSESHKLLQVKLMRLTNKLPIPSLASCRENTPTNKIKCESSTDPFKKNNIMSNKVKILARYKAWNLLIRNNYFLKKYKEFNDMLSNVLSINNVGLQVKIIEYATQIPTSTTLEILNELLDKQLNDVLKFEILNSISVIKIAIFQKANKDNQACVFLNAMPQLNSKAKPFIKNKRK